MDVRSAMAESGIGSAAVLRRALRDRGLILSLAQVRRIAANRVERPSLQLIAALCDAFHCEVHRVLVREMDAPRASHASEVHSRIAAPPRGSRPVPQRLLLR